MESAFLLTAVNLIFMYGGFVQSQETLTSVGDFCRSSVHFHFMLMRK